MTNTNKFNGHPEVDGAYVYKMAAAITALALAAPNSILVVTAKQLIALLVTKDAALANYALNRPISVSVLGQIMTQHMQPVLNPVGITIEREYVGSYARAMLYVIYDNSIGVTQEDIQQVINMFLDSPYQVGREAAAARKRVAERAVIKRAAFKEALEKIAAQKEKEQQSAMNEGIGEEKSTTLSLDDRLKRLKAAFDIEGEDKDARVKAKSATNLTIDITADAVVVITEHLLGNNFYDGVVQVRLQQRAED